MAATVITVGDPKARLRCTAAGLTNRQPSQPLIILMTELEDLILHSSIRKINLMYNIRRQQLDKLEFVGNIGEVLATLTLKAPIVTQYFPDMSIEISQYLLAGIFVGNVV